MIVYGDRMFFFQYTWVSILFWYEYYLGMNTFGSRAPVFIHFMPLGNATWEDPLVGQTYFIKVDIIYLPLKVA